jgi:hypothetical protein
MPRTISEALEHIRESGIDVLWLGGCTADAIRVLERLLGVPLPLSFRGFLELTGGGELDRSVISGIEDDDPLLENAGTVWGDTSRCRSEFGPPKHLIVVYFADDEVCWCLDSSRPDAEGEYVAVADDTLRREVERDIAPCFAAFLWDFVELRAGAD